MITLRAHNIKTNRVKITCCFIYYNKIITFDSFNLLQFLCHCQIIIDQFVLSSCCGTSVAFFYSQSQFLFPLTPHSSLPITNHIDTCPPVVSVIVCVDSKCFASTNKLSVLSDSLSYKLDQPSDPCYLGKSCIFSLL